MLRSTNHFLGWKVGPADCEIGRIKDLCFDDHLWAVRYIIAETAADLPLRQVLISPHAISKLHELGPIVREKLSWKYNLNAFTGRSSQAELVQKRQSQGQDGSYHWRGDSLCATNGAPLIELPATALPMGHAIAGGNFGKESGVHLRSVKALNGYYVETRDGRAGLVCDFMMDPQSWLIHQVVVKIGHGLYTREVRISSAAADKIDSNQSTIFVKLTRREIENCPTHNSFEIPESSSTAPTRHP